MADIPYLQNEDLEDSEEAVEDEEEDEDEDEIGVKGCEDDGCGQMLMPFEQLLQNSGSQTTFNRQMVGRILLEYFKSAVESNNELNVDEVFNTVNQIVSDPDPSIRLDLVEQLPHVAVICQEMPHLFGDALSHYIIGIILKYLRDSDNQVRQTAQAALIAIVERGILTKKQLEFEVCPVILKMTYMQTEFLNTAIVLMSKLGPYLGSELLETILLDRYLILCEDEKFFVRKVCASYLGEICANISKAVVYAKLLPKYINLCMDEVWGVRKACVDVMLSVASCVTIYEHRKTLSKLLKAHLKDDSKWVRTSAYQILGPFISIFATQFTGLRYNQFGDFIMSHNQGSVLRQNVIPSTKNESVVGPNDSFATPLEQEIGILGIDMYSSSKGKVKNGKKMQLYGRNDYSEKEKQNLGSSEETSGDDVNKFNPFQYYYIPPEMPLDVELVQPGDQTPNIEKAFINDIDDIFNRIMSEEKYRMSHKNSCQEESQESLMAENKNNDNNEELPVIGLNLENSNLNFENTESVFNSNSANFLETSPTPESNESCEEESMEIDEKKEMNLLDVEEMEISSRKVDMMLKSKGIDLDLNNLYVKFDTWEFNVNLKNTDETVPQFLIESFVSMVHPSPLNEVIGTEIHHQCAFFFPAVVMTLGRKKWFQLKKAYQALACALQWKVRCTLASSIHEIALILGDELAGCDLMPIYDGFIKDLDEVRIGALKHLSTFLEVLRPSDRQQYLPKLSDFIVTDNEWNWRFREEFANQLLQAIPLYKPEDISEHIAPLALQLLQDKVAAVRQIALALITKIIMNLGSKEALVIALIQELNHQLIFNKWKSRQTYALICSQLVSTGSINIDIFANEMLPYLHNLGEDKVPNVRLVVARTLANDIMPMGIDGFDVETTRLIIEKLKQDPDRDVRVLAGGCDPKELNDHSLNHTFLLDAF